MDSINRTPTDARHQGQATLPPSVERALAEAVDRLRFGVVQLTIHDGRVVQIDVTERQRFT